MSRGPRREYFDHKDNGLEPAGSYNRGAGGYQNVNDFFDNVPGAGGGNMEEYSDSEPDMEVDKAAGRGRGGGVGRGGMVGGGGGNREKVDYKHLAESRKHIIEELEGHKTKYELQIRKLTSQVKMHEDTIRGQNNSVKALVTEKEQLVLEKQKLSNWGQALQAQLRAAGIRPVSMGEAQVPAVRHREVHPNAMARQTVTPGPSQFSGWGSVGHQGQAPRPRMSAPAAVQRSAGPVAKKQRSHNEVSPRASTNSKTEVRQLAVAPSPPPKPRISGDQLPPRQGEMVPKQRSPAKQPKPEQRKKEEEELPASVAVVVIGKGQVRFSCVHCQKLFVKLYLLKDHLWDEHKVVDQRLAGIGCTVCGKIFDTRGQFTQHSVEAHGRVNKKSRAAKKRAASTSPKPAPIANRPAVRKRTRSEAAEESPQCRQQQQTPATQEKRRPGRPKSKKREEEQEPPVPSAPLEELEHKTPKRGRGRPKKKPRTRSPKAKQSVDEAPSGSRSSNVSPARSVRSEGGVRRSARTPVLPSKYRQTIMDSPKRRSHSRKAETEDEDDDAEQKKQQPQRAPVMRVQTAVATDEEEEAGYDSGDEEDDDEEEEEVQHKIVEERDFDCRTGTGFFKCMCGKKFQRRATANTHVQRGNRGRIFQCHLCSKSFVAHNVLKTHYQTVHKQEYDFCKFSCNECGLIAFETRHELMEHRLEEHGRPNRARAD